MKPGESRIVREEPCPPEQMHRGNQYWQLRRAAERLWEGRFDHFWKNPVELKELIDSITLLREVADTHPSKPYESWGKYQLGVVREICCPCCEHVFEWRGKFYAPQCSNCKAWLNEKPSAEEVKGNVQP